MSPSAHSLFTALGLLPGGHRTSSVCTSLLRPGLLPLLPAYSADFSSPTIMLSPSCPSPVVAIPSLSPSSSSSHSVATSSFFPAFSIEDESPMMRLGRRLFGHAKGRRTHSCSSSEVSVETMAITALPRESFECWLKERLKKWIQLSGHEGSIIPASCTSLYKKQTGTCTEGVSYKAIQAEPALREFAPKYYQEIEKNNEMFIEIEDLLSRFEDPAHTAIMDIKIGTRTFLESEVSNTKMRADLYKKMTDIDPFEATEEERERGEITKLRYMQFRERESSTAQLGFRIEAAKTPGGALEKNFKKVRTAADVTAVLRNFFGPDRKRVVEGLLSRLRDLRRAVEQSTFFKQHEVVGSSLLLLFDGSKVGVWMIDFAKASRLPPGKTLTHRASWQPGNAEDGYLIGIDNLIQILEDMPLKEPALSVIEERER